MSAPSERRTAGRGWMMVEGMPPGRWPTPSSSAPTHPQTHLQSHSSTHPSTHPPTHPPDAPSASTPRFNPYHRRFNFTLQDIDRCLFGKQQLRIVRIADLKSPKPAGGEDKNRPAKWCDICQDVRFGECPQHDPLPSPHQSLNLDGAKSYAISTFPEEVGLCISTIPFAGYGVFAKLFIPKGTWIGPYEGKKISVEEGMKQIKQGDAPYLWEIYDNFHLTHFLDASDENASSWMRFIQCARHPREQNMFVFQYCGNIYYRVYKDITVGCELLLWYDDKYPQYFGMPCEIRDLVRDHSMESIQAPLEVSKMTEERPPHHDTGRSGQFLHGKPRPEPPRISSYQGPPVQPPTLTQAPHMTHSPHVERANLVMPRSAMHTTTSRPGGPINVRGREFHEKEEKEHGFYKHLPLVMSVSEKESKKMMVAMQEQRRFMQHVRHETPPEWEQVMRCQGCGQTFKQKAAFDKHNCAAITSLEAAKPFQCSRCQLSFQEATQLQDHMLVQHSAERPFKCTICVRSFNALATLNAHMRIHDPPAHHMKDTPECHKCGKHFQYVVELTKHLSSECSA